MIVLAYDPVKSVQDLPMAAQIDALALTVWPTLLRPAISEADELNAGTGYQERRRSHRSPAKIRTRICCAVVQGAVRRRLQARGARGSRRGRRCARDPQRHRARAHGGRGLLLVHRRARTDPGWRAAVGKWEALDRAAAEWINEIERRGDPDNWPISGAASEEDPGLPEAELTMRGDIVVDGHAYGPNRQRIQVLPRPPRKVRRDRAARSSRCDAGPGSRVLLDARAAGCTHVAVIAREPAYPYHPPARLLDRVEASGFCARTCAETDSLQLLLHAVDEVAGPGTVARVDLIRNRRARSSSRGGGQGSQLDLLLDGFPDFIRESDSRSHSQ